MLHPIAHVCLGHVIPAADLLLAKALIDGMAQSVDHDVYTEVRPDVLLHNEQPADKEFQREVFRV